jgi:putative chitinase
MLTADLIRSLAPRARDDYVAALVSGGDVLEKAAINTPMRLAQFGANLSHETGGFTIVRENGNYSAKRLLEVWPKHFTASSAKKYANNPEKLFNFIYGPDTPIGKVLGNTHLGDGFAFRGGGCLQTTGRYNYTKIGKEIGVDLENHPELIEQADVSLKAAANEFAKFVHLCDRGEVGFRAVCNGVNRGNIASRLDPIGWVDRQRQLKRWTDALSASVVVDDTLELGDHGPLVTAFQERLAALGYAIGRADGIYGSRARAAVAAFQLENHLKTDGVIGPETRKALNSESAIPMPVGERSTETAADLKAAGSETILTTQNIKRAAVGIGGTSAVTGAGQQAAPVDIIVATKDVAAEISSWKAITSLIGETFAWATSHLWILGIVVAFCFYRWGSKIEWRRLLDHRSGANLGR